MLSQLAESCLEKVISFTTELMGFCFCHNKPHHFGYAFQKSCVKQWHIKICMNRVHHCKSIVWQCKRTLFHHWM